ncbi:Crp/Fnr family transcriptional regulator [Allopusillimonas ginsengisoli]|nr:Crp/Fnr family transcriptional regulator [Allopusillimonas ginsengisoli]
MKPLELLRKQKLLANLDESMLIQIQRDIHVQRFERRQMVARHGVGCDSLMMLLHGRLQVVALAEDGREIDLDFVEPGDYFGELSIIDGQPGSVSIVAVADSYIGFLPRHKTRWLFHHCPEVIEEVLQKLCSTIRQASNQRSVLGLNRAYSRVYAVLMNTAKNPTGHLVTIENLPNQQGIAVLANVSRETVSRAIQALVNTGIVQKDYSRLIVRKPQILEKLAKGEAEIQVRKKPREKAA